MSLTLDPEIAAALAPMAEAGFPPPAVGDIAGRRAMWEPISAQTRQSAPISPRASPHSDFTTDFPCLRAKVGASTPGLQTRQAVVARRLEGIEVPLEQ